MRVFCLAIAMAAAPVVAEPVIPEADAPTRSGMEYASASNLLSDLCKFSPILEGDACDRVALEPSEQTATEFIRAELILDQDGLVGLIYQPVEQAEPRTTIY
ncbi:hypothetical protein [Pontivivens insulae]|uniref:Uncharacterized protein n=1 Tax=Pontivivens insulae TaxID=1639689 RepID=A0A2R8AF20_9RHOB|nr:hypothetical protein [Pontivivens insulae]RED12073.1 hypothetical protein DFR53_2786 [Pontivivens insulae]SPF30829.1 hypothetical protein POI8812_03173 [Pontivivens insulae]